MSRDEITVYALQAIYWKHLQIEISEISLFLCKKLSWKCSHCYHLHGVAEEQALGRDAADLVHESVLPGEEALQAAAERAARRHAGLVQLVEPLHH